MSVYRDIWWIKYKVIYCNFQVGLCVYLYPKLGRIIYSHLNVTRKYGRLFGRGVDQGIQDAAGWQAGCLLRDCIGFAFLRFMIGLENPCHPRDQSEAKLKPIATWSLMFPALQAGYLYCLWLAHSGNFPLFWLAVMITLVLVFGQSIEKSSILDLCFLGHEVLSPN